MGNYHSQPSRISERSANPALIELSSRLIGAGQRPSTLVENALQIDLFMQNKPNFRKSQMNANLYNTRDYERKRDWTLGQNKPNSNPIKPNFQKAKMNINSIITKDYRKKDDFAVRINKPNSNPIFKKPKMNVNLYVIEDYENKTALRLEQNKPKQIQFQNTTPKEREEKKVSGKLLKKQFYFFLVADPANPTLYSENTDT